MESGWVGVELARRALAKSRSGRVLLPRSAEAASRGRDGVLEKFSPSTIHDRRDYNIRFRRGSYAPQALLTCRGGLLSFGRRGAPDAPTRLKAGSTSSSFVPRLEHLATLEGQVLAA